MTLVTTRLDAQVSRVANRAEWYRRRWQVDTALAHLKTTMPMDGLRCQTVAGVLKDWPIFARVSHWVRMVMGASAIRHHLDVERSSVVDARRWLGAPSTGSPLRTLVLEPIATGHHRHLQCQGKVVRVRFCSIGLGGRR
jgi:hypothetical protein